MRSRVFEWPWSALDHLATNERGFIHIQFYVLYKKQYRFWSWKKKQFIFKTKRSQIKIKIIYRYTTLYINRCGYFKRTYYFTIGFQPWDYWKNCISHLNFFAWVRDYNFVFHIILPLISFFSFAFISESWSTNALIIWIEFYLLM